MGRQLTGDRVWVGIGWGWPRRARSQRLAEEAAVEGYQAGRLSHPQVGEMLGLDYGRAERFLAKRNVASNYSLTDLQADRATLEEVLAWEPD